jgi:choline kinase
MGAHGESRPKCLLHIAGRPLLAWTVDNLRRVGCDEIVVVTGHLAAMIDMAGIVKVQNSDYWNNNILHSLMYARDFLNGPVVVSYSDIWVEPSVYGTLMETSGDIVIAVDRDWRAYYEDRTDHPLSEAENVDITLGSTVARIGKSLDSADAIAGEFLGLWRMSANGTKVFRENFEKLEESLDPLSPFQRAAEWRKAYVTDLLQHLVDRGARVDCALVDRGWAELDTPQDYERLPLIAARQNLTTLVEAGIGR